MTPALYLGSRAATLGSFALLESAVVVAIAGRGVELRPLPLAAGVLAAAVLQTWVGLALAARFQSVTAFLLPTGALAASALQLPFLALFDVGPAWLWWLVPTRAPMALMQAAFGPGCAIDVIAGALGSTLWLIVAALFARRALARHVGWRS